MSSAIVVLSGGLDSSVNLAMAKEEMNVKMAITFDYGQRAVSKETRASRQLCAHYQIPHKIVPVPWIREFGKSALLDQSQSVPTHEVEIDDRSTSLKTATKVWVPNRNGIFLNIAAGWAEAMECEYIIPGFNKEEAATFPDNSMEFIQTLIESFSYSTANQVNVKCYTIQMMKTEIVSMAIQKKLPLEMLWPCYLDGDQWCGQCESCQRSKRAFKDNGLDLNVYFKHT
ncbi:MAG: 7-cyano-7-deazaguanine synthase QueC [Bdellovibrionaceae bacterium]|nr:7-cyano-7-deazaguanine synthase QueC [Pseudobdellovibrionaceae bacterium]